MVLYTVRGFALAIVPALLPVAASSGFENPKVSKFHASVFHEYRRSAHLQRRSIDVDVDMVFL